MTCPDVSGVHLPDKVPNVRSSSRLNEIGGCASPRGLYAGQEILYHEFIDFTTFIQGFLILLVYERK